MNLEHRVNLKVDMDGYQVNDAYLIVDTYPFSYIPCIQLFSYSKGSLASITKYFDGLLLNFGDCLLNNKEWIYNMMSTNHIGLYTGYSIESNHQMYPIYTLNLLDLDNWCEFYD